MDGKGTFFSQLRSLCTHVDSRVNSLKQELSLPPCQTPQRYDEGLNKLKKDVRELKKQSQEIQENLSVLNRFGGYLKDAKELVEEQMAGTDKMEQFCAQYGYVIPTKPDADTPPRVEVTTPPPGDNSSASEDSRHQDSDSLQVTPELSLHAQMVLQGKELPLLTPGRKATATSTHLFPETPITAKTPITPMNPITPGMASSIPRPFMMMGEWMTGGRGGDDSCAPSTDSFNTKSPWKTDTPAAGKQTEARESMQTPSQNASLDNTKSVSYNQSLLTDSCKVKVNVPRVITTPTEPTLSALATQTLMQISRMKVVSVSSASPLGAGGGSLAEPQRTTQITTPEEPVLYSHHTSFISNKSSYEENGTPEEPMLHYKEGLGLEGAPQQKATPEEPILSLSYQDNISFGAKGSAKNELVPSYQHTVTPTAPPHNAGCRRPKDHKAEVPCTPELSDVTMSFLSFITQQPPPPQPPKEHQEHKHTQKDPKEQEQPYRNLKGLSQPHRDSHHKLGQSFSAAMNKINTSYNNNENIGTKPEPHHHWSSSSATLKDKATRGEAQGTTLDHTHMEDFPPSPQLSDITQKILGQLGH